MISNSHSSCPNASSSSFDTSPPILSSSSSSINQSIYFQEEPPRNSIFKHVSNAVSTIANAISGITTSTRQRDRSVGASNYLEEKNNSGVDSKVNDNSIFYGSSYISSHERCDDSASSSSSSKNTRRRDQEDGYRSGGEEQPDSVVTANVAFDVENIERKGRGHTVVTSDTIELCSSDDDLDTAADEKSSEHDTDKGMKTKTCSKHEINVNRNFNPIQSTVTILKDNRILSTETETQPLNDDIPFFASLKNYEKDEKSKGKDIRVESDNKRTSIIVEKSKNEERSIEYMAISKDSVAKGSVSRRQAAA